MKKNIAIIGAGLGGIAAAKSCLEYGLTPTVFEKSSHIGGVWSGADNGSAWNGMHTNLSKWSCMFSDFPWSDETQEFPFQNEVAQYLRDYSDAFHVTPHINLNSEVTKCYKVGSQWAVDVNGRTEIFDDVIVASGFFAKGAQPEIAGEENFAGKILHSSKAHPDIISKDDSIVVCGGSFSGYELAAEFAAAAQNPIIHVLRRPARILKRQFPDGKGGSLPVDLASYSRKVNPLDATLSLEQKTARTISYLRTAFGDPKEYHPALTLDENPSRPQFNVISDHYLGMVKEGKIIPVRGEITHYNQQTVSINNTQDTLADTVVWATGFKASLPFFGDDIKSKIGYVEDDKFMPALLLDAVWPQGVDGLAFVGFNRGPYFAGIELQSRWVAAVFAGAVPAPSPAELDAGVADALSLRNLNPRPQFPYGRYVEFADRLARKVGCYPDLPNTDKLLQQVNEGFFLPSHYRLMGHCANRAVVEQVLAQIPYIK